MRWTAGFSRDPDRRRLYWLLHFCSDLPVAHRRQLLQFDRPGRDWASDDERRIIQVLFRIRRPETDNLSVSRAQ